MGASSEEMSGPPAGMLYWLRSCPYVSVTNRTRGLSLVASRGPSFLMPPESGFVTLGAEPTLQQIVDGVLDAYRTDERKKNLGADVGRTQRADGGATDPGICFAGLGEPIIRWRDLCEATEQIRYVHPNIPIRINTNGLLLQDDESAVTVANALVEAGVNDVTVALNDAEAQAYTHRMLTPPDYAPAYHSNAEEAIGNVDGASLSSACEFIVAMQEAGITVVVSCVTKPGTDVATMRNLASALGAIDCKERSWHPDIAVDDSAL